MRALFLRGLTREIRHWDGLPEKFQAQTGIPVITLDLPGAGENAALTSPTNINHYVEFLRKHLPKGEPITLIGISMGGMIALRWAELYPGEVHKVFTINSSANNLSSANERFNFGHWRVILKYLMSSDLENNEKLILKITTNLITDKKKEELGKYFKQVQLAHPVARKSSINQLIAARSFQIFQKVSVPTHVIYSLGDRLVDPSCSKKLADVLKAQTHIHPEAGHDIPLDAPEWLLSVLANNI
jgi:pimeloyl-ACP methyl ester carboxylesterase